jgi:hypothetical protein
MEINAELILKTHKDIKDEKKSITDSYFLKFFARNEGSETGYNSKARKNRTKRRSVCNSFTGANYC